MIVFKSLKAWGVWLSILMLVGCGDDVSEKESFDGYWALQEVSVRQPQTRARDQIVEGFSFVENTSPVWHFKGDREGNVSVFGKIDSKDQLLKPSWAVKDVSFAVNEGELKIELKKGDVKGNPRGESRRFQIESKDKDGFILTRKLNNMTELKRKFEQISADEFELTKSNLQNFRGQRGIKPSVRPFEE